MNLSAAAELLWGSRSKTRFLVITALVLILTCLGAKEIWTQEHRWADIVAGMFYRHDFFHPYLGESQYYDKPLLSYWLIAAATWLTNGLNTWSLRLPSALSGLLAIWSIYQIGKTQRDHSFGLICGWMLVTTFFIVFWARVSSADMMNVAGSLLAIAWYLSKRKAPTWLDYCIFFVIIALTSLCKGLGGAAVPLLAVLVDMCQQKSFKQHLTIKLVTALIPGIIIYVTPFLLSAYLGTTNYSDNGLYLVYKENILRYFQPFDHQGPIYTYFEYLPIYLMPWTLFFIPALISLPRRWKLMTEDNKWNVWVLAVVFLFFTLSGSRRSYYVLPMVPFAILVTADWIAAASTSCWRQKLAALCAIISAMLILVGMDIIPAWYYARCGIERFAISLKREAEHQHPWYVWNVVMLDAETKLNFYLNLPPTVKNYDTKGDRKAQTMESLQKRWPILSEPQPNTIIISRKLYESVLDKAFPTYIKVTMPQGNCFPFVKKNNENLPVAYIPTG